MGRKSQHSEEGGGGHSVGLWYVSFSDMITLLLSFFVMLTTFSSYSKEAMVKLGGVWATLADYSVLSGNSVNDALAPPADREVDRTDKGSEKPTAAPPDFIENPLELSWSASAAQAYHNRRVLRIPAGKLFWGLGTQGTLLSGAGVAHLKLLASFIHEVPCRVLIGDSISSRVLPAAAGSELNRPYAIMEYLRENGGIEPKRMGLSLSGPELADRMGEDGVIEIVLLSEKANHE